nr:MAG TPA: Regulatory protein regulator, helix-turn-helix, Restriction-modification, TRANSCRIPTION.0A [Caudoviricetes sp.]
MRLKCCDTHAPNYGPETGHLVGALRQELSRFDLTGPLLGRYGYSHAAHKWATPERRDTMNALQTELKLRIINDGGSVRAFAKKVGLSRTTLARKLSGESDFTLGEIATISAALGYETPSRLMADAEARTEEAA